MANSIIPSPRAAMSSCRKVAIALSAGGQRVAAALLRARLDLHAVHLRLSPWPAAGPG